MVLTVSYALARSGAAIAGLRMKDAAEQFYYPVRSASVRESRNVGETEARAATTIHMLRLVAERVGLLAQRSTNPVKHSLNFFGSPRVRRQVNAERGVVHLQWINNCVLSLSDIGRIRQPLVITLHDEWWYLGAAHYRQPERASRRFIEGYERNNKDVRGIDLNRWTWERKRKALNRLTQAVVFTVPSTWMLEQAQQSRLLQGRDIRVIPNCLDVSIFRPQPAAEWRQAIGAEPEDRIVLFGAVGGAGNPLKGHDLLLQALERLANRKESERLLFVSFGGTRKGAGEVAGIRHVELGRISSKAELAEVYSGADVTVVPSRLEAFGQVAAESSACETPVVAFQDTGVADIVESGVTGYLAPHGHEEELAHYIAEVLIMPPSARKEMGKRAREHVVARFSMEIVGRQLADLYEQLLKCATTER